MTPAPISVERLRELLEKATPGPWTVVAGDNYMIEADSYPGTYPHRFPGDDTGPFVAYIGNRSADYGEADAQLIAEMREALPALLQQLAEREAEVERLRRECDLRKHAVDRWVPCPDHRDKTDGRCQVCAKEAAERAREEWRDRFIHVSAMRYMDNGLMHDKAHEAAEKDAAFLAASGGSRED